MTYLHERDLGATAARRARERLGLGAEAPVADVVETVEEQAGVPVTILKLPSSIAGLFGRKQDRGFIFVNGEQSSERQRFTVAHEFGHAELGHEGLLDYIEDVFGGTGKRPPREIQANGFAAEFVAPLSGVRGWLARAGEPDVSLETVVRLAHHFHVSAEVALYRLQNALRLTNATIEPLKAAIDMDEHLAVRRRLGLSDCGDIIARSALEGLPRFPRSTVSHAVSAYERGLLTAEQIADLLQVESATISAELERRGVLPPADERDY